MILSRTVLRSGDGEHGISLVEMLVVLAIIASAYALVAPRTRGPVERVELRAVAMDLAGRFRAARAQAIAYGRTVAVNFDTKARAYAVDGETAGHVLPAGVAVTVVAARALAADNGLSRIAFFSDGSASGGRVVLARGSQQIVVGVEWLTGATGVEALP